MINIEQFSFNSIFLVFFPANFCFVIGCTHCIFIYLIFLLFFIQTLLTLMNSRPGSQLMTSSSQCLCALAKNLMARLNYHQDPSMYCPKQGQCGCMCRIAINFNLITRSSNPLTFNRT